MIVTVSRQMGSWGRRVAEEAARMLNYQFVWRELINQAASRAGVPEVALATIDELGFLGLKPSASAQLAYHQAVRNLMNEMAAEGNYIIVGRAGQVILASRPDVLHVRVIAPNDIRVERIAVEKNITLSAAAEMLERSDHARAHYLRHYYQAQIDDPLLYGLIINTGRLSVQAAAAAICQAVMNGSERSQESFAKQ